MKQKILYNTKAPCILIDGAITDYFFTTEQLQRDVDFFRAQKITRSMLDSGLISLSQFDKLTALNRKTFSPFLAEIMPKTVDNITF